MTNFTHLIMLIVTCQMKLPQFPVVSCLSSAVLYHYLWLPLTFSPFNLLQLPPILLNSCCSIFHFTDNLSLRLMRLLLSIYLYIISFFLIYIDTWRIFVLWPGITSLGTNSILSCIGTFPAGFLQSWHHKTGENLTSGVSNYFSHRIIWTMEVTETLKKISHTVLIHQKVRLRGGMTCIDWVFHNLCKMNQLNSSMVKKKLGRNCRKENNQ